MNRCILLSILAVVTLTSCGVAGTDRAVVVGTGPDTLLKLRSGPGLGLPDGTAVNRRACVTEVGQRWCEVSLAVAPSVTGYVAADYLAAE